MMHRALLRAGLRAAGKNYEPDPELPAGLVVRVTVQRVTWLLRGSIRLRSRVFVGPRVRIRGRRRLFVGRGSTIEDGSVIDAYGRLGVRIGERCKIGSRTSISTTSHLSLFGEGVVFGDDSGVGQDSYFGAAGGIRIGRDVIMGPFVSFHSQNHNHADLTRPIREQGTSEVGIVVEDNCWIGARVTFLDGTHVGRDSIVAAGAVVTGRFPDGSIIGGVPARVLRRRSGPAMASVESELCTS